LKCERARELTSEALDDALTNDVAEDFHRHLDDCPPCRTFFAEMKESLLLLDELPILEVRDSFDDAVWARLRAERSPAPAWSGLRDRVVELIESIRLAPPVWKWSPVGVAAALLLFLGISSSTGPLAPAPGRIADRSPTVESPTASPTSLPTRAAGGSSAATVVAEVSDVVDESAGDIPEAIERFLERNESRELRLDADSDRYRRSNYRYPLRRVPDPSTFGGVGSVPVVGPTRPVPNRDPILPVAQPASEGAAVIAF
jgi:hypothetical protein